MATCTPERKRSAGACLHDPPNSVNAHKGPLPQPKENAMRTPPACLALALLQRSTLALTITVLACSEPEPKSYEDCILTKVKAGMSDSAVALVTQACSSKFAAATMSLEEFALTELRDVHTEGSLDRDTFDFTLYNGSNIEISEVTFAVRTRSHLHEDLEEIRHYRTLIDLKPLQTANVSIRVIADDGVKGFVLYTAKGIRRRG
jgi:hypothetical protein